MTKILAFVLANWHAILGLGKQMYRGIMRIIYQDKLVPGFRVDDEVVILSTVEGAAKDLEGRIGRVGKTAVPNHLAVTVVNQAGSMPPAVRVEAIKPEHLQRVIRKN